MRSLVLVLVLILAGCAPVPVPILDASHGDAGWCAGCSAACIGGEPRCNGLSCRGCWWDCPAGTAPGCGTDPIARCFRPDGTERMWSVSCVR